MIIIVIDSEVDSKLFTDPGAFVLFNNEYQYFNFYGACLKADTRLLADYESS
jgi:hypothetical protein